MDEYLNRSDLLAEYDRQHKGPPGEARRLIAEAPAADVVPVVHGEWITLTECANEGAYCSVCHKKVYRVDYARCVKKNKVRSNYCPNCGAKMKDGEWL